MTSCGFIRAEEWMKQVYGISVRGCTYQLTPYCQYWKECAVELGIDWFASNHLNALFQSCKEEILATREAIANGQALELKRKILRKQTRKYTFRAKRKKDR